MRLRFLALVLLLVLPVRASAEWQVKPFFGATFGGGTTFVDPDHAAGNAKVAIGVNALLLGNVLGVEADVGHTPGFFQAGDQSLVLQSGVTTITGSLVVAVPRHLTEYSLRPYFVGGAGLLCTRIEDKWGILVDRQLPAVGVGGGATGFLTRRIGLNWDVRYFRSIGRSELRGVSLAAEELSFWRAIMALVIRH